jgi:hypothetical protein
MVAKVMNAELQHAPESVMVLAERCLTHIKNRLGMDIDFQQETLSVVDCFIDDVLKEEALGVNLPPGDKRRVNLSHLLGPSIGAYFGEVLRRVFPCRWRVSSDDPGEWFIEFELVPLRFNPVGAAAEALMAQNVVEWNGAIVTQPDYMEALFERLAAAPPVPEGDFFSLATRFEVLQIAQEYLHMRQMSEESGPDLQFYSPEDYDRLFG